MSDFWSPLVHELTPYTPGEQPQIEGLIKLNTNENPYGPSPRVLQAIAAANNGELRKYPDPSASGLKNSIAYFATNLAVRSNGGPFLDLGANVNSIPNSSNSVHRFLSKVKETLVV